MTYNRKIFLPLVTLENLKRKLYKIRIPLIETHMKKTVRSILMLILCLIISTSYSLFAESNNLILKQSETLRYALLVNDYFMRTYPDVGANSYVGGKTRDSKIWTRGVYYEGLMSLYRQYPQDKMLKYAEDWGKYHKWISAGSNAKRHADYQCAGQTYLDLYMLKPTETVRKTHIKGLIDEMMATTKIDDWYWIDAIQMAMPLFAQLGVIEEDESYFKRMYEMYMYSRNKHGGNGKGGGLPLFNETDGLWYRDYQYDPPYKDLTETDKPCYWSRGNGWVYVALARVMYYSPNTLIYKEQYVDDFLKMSEAILNCQREDGFWGVSLAAPTNTGHVNSPGPETSGTALFLAGMAYGIRTGLLDKETYLPAVIKGWNTMCKEAVHEDGFLGYVQGTGAKPEDGQPVTHTSVPNFEDYGIGCFLLAAAEVYQLGDIDLSSSSIENENLSESGVGLNYSVFENNIYINILLPQQTSVSLSIYDMRGYLVNQISESSLSAGEHEFFLPQENMNGLYICILKTSLGVQVKKIIVSC